MSSLQFSWYITVKLLSIILSETLSISLYPRSDQNLSEVVNIDNPLFLTPLIKTDKIIEAQNLSRVHLHGHIVDNIESYAGYLTVNKKYNSNLFFWFFPALFNYTNAPVILWLQGGPGLSSLYGIFVEHGPFSIKKNMELEFRPYSWTLEHSVIYIDNPVGTGFSFTESSDGYANDETMMGNDLYQALLQFFQLFPNLQNNPFFIIGESYAGKFVPAVSHVIHCNNLNTSNRINLQGMAIGNGFIDPANQIGYGNYLFQLGFADSQQRDELQRSQSRIQELIKNQQWKEASEKLFQIVDDIFDVTNLNDDAIYNYFYTEDSEDAKNWEKFVQIPKIRNILHVGNATEFHFEAFEVGEHLKLDETKSVVPLISELLDHYRILIYSGQLDIMVAYPFAENFINLMNFTGSNEYKNGKRQPLYVDQKLTGYLKKAGNLSDVLIRNAGHMVPLDQPKAAYYLISCFIKNEL